MISSLSTLLLTAGLLTPAQAQQKPQEPQLTRILVVTGRDVPAHNWREVTPVLREHLEKTGKYELVVSEEPMVLESSVLSSYDVILLNYYNWQRPTISDKAKENLLAFVKNGKGLVCFHFSVRAFNEWPEYRKLIGRVWLDGSGHGPRGTFKVKITKPDHFITEGIADFEADDELYAKLVGDTPINVLAEAHSEWSKQTEPLAWTLDYGRGRVFSLVLGHDVKAVSGPQFARLLQRGTDWTARKDAK